VISAAQLHAFAPRCDAAVWAPALEAACARFEIDSDLRLTHFLAQVSQESAGLTVFEENLNYSAEALAKLWPGRFAPPLNAQYARQPERIANRAYMGRMGNGDEASGDGWRFRGRGPIQITGRAGYVALSPVQGVDLEGSPDALLQPALGALVAAQYWAERGCNELADADDIKTITRRINGGLTGLDGRQAAFQAARAIWPA
jgi:putative chitinase